MAPTPTPVATAAASACRRVTPRRAGTAAESARLGSSLDAHGFNSIGAVDQLHHPDAKNS